MTACTVFAMKRNQSIRLLDKAIKTYIDELADVLLESHMLLHTYKAVEAGETITEIIIKATQGTILNT